MICNPAIVGGGGNETAIITVKCSFTSNNPELGVWYIDPDGTNRYASISATEFTIQAMKGSFLFPVGIGNIAQDALSGALQEVPNTGFYTRNNYESILVYVSGDGSIFLG